MLLVLVNIISCIISAIIKTILLIAWLILKVFQFIFKINFLRAFFIIFTFGYILKVNFNTLSTIYFFYLMHLSALSFNIYKKVYINLNYLFNKLYSFIKIESCLKSLKKETLILHNIFLENDSEDYCYIDEIVITSNGIFIIKTPKSCYDEFLYDINNKCHNNNLNEDKIINSNLLYKLSDECSNCCNILQDILSPDIPITNIIALPNDNSVVVNDSNLKTLIVTAKELPFYIKNNINKNINISISKIKEKLLENKLWITDIVFLNLNNFFNYNKTLILFVTLFFLLYHIYISSISYIFFKFIK